MNGEIGEMEETVGTTVKPVVQLGKPQALDMNFIVKKIVGKNAIHQTARSRK